VAAKKLPQQGVGGVAQVGRIGGCIKGKRVIDLMTFAGTDGSWCSVAAEF
jgi:hypothetical protein